MEFTGERVVPGKVEPDLLHEHLSRYYFARPLVEGRCALDVGCGTGYGAAVLAQSARRVLALDVSAESVAFAKKNYPACNAEFLVADCCQIPLSPQTVDTAVCFEVIEHLAEQAALLEEVRRVLRPDGLLVISTPNRIYYSEERKEVNPFHVRELSFRELETLLRAEFAHTRFWGQRPAVGCFTYALGRSQARGPQTLRSLTIGGEAVADGVAELEDPVYLLAVCCGPTSNRGG